MSPSERVLNLLALAASRAEPISLAEITTRVSGYRMDNSESARRKFERDKKVLEELGAPLRYIPAAGDTEGGYVLEHCGELRTCFERYPEAITYVLELAAGLCDTGGFADAAGLRSAIDKIVRWKLGTAPAARRAKVPAGGDAEIYARWMAAVCNRTTVEIDYFTYVRAEVNRRVIEPYGLIHREGDWIIIAFCRLRGAVRRFKLSRVQAVRFTGGQAGRPYEAPAEFDLDEFTDEQRWNWLIHPRRIVELRFDPSLAPLVKRTFGDSVVECGRRGTHGFARVMTSNESAVLEWTFDTYGAVEVFAPRRLAGQWSSRARVAGAPPSAARGRG